MYELDYRTSEEIWVSVVRYFEMGKIDEFNNEFEKYERALRRESEERLELYPILNI